MKYNDKYNGLFKTYTTLSCYWLGLIASDGCISKHKNSFKVGLGLKQSDGYLIYQFARDIGLSEQRVKMVDFKGATEPFIRIEIVGSELYSDLINMGIMPRKSLLISELNIPLEYRYHFIQGVFEGDGSVGIYRRSKCNTKRFQWSIVGHFPFLKYIQKLLLVDDINSIVTNTKPEKNFGVLKITKPRELIKLYLELYNNNLPCMIRKKDIFENIILTIFTQKTKRHPAITLECSFCNKPLKKRITNIHKSNYCCKQCYTNDQYRRRELNAYRTLSN